MKAPRDCASETGDKGLDTHTLTHAHHLHTLDENQMSVKAKIFYTYI